MLRRCDSLPTNLREIRVTSPEATKPLTSLIPDSNTDPNINATQVRDKVIATWETLRSDVKNINNGFLTKNSTNAHDKKEPSRFISTFTCNKKEIQKKITYDNNHVVVTQQCDRSSSFPLGANSNKSIQKRSSLRRRTLLERLLSWRTPECDCELQCRPKVSTPKMRTKEILCTCGVVQANVPDKQNKYGERGRSKSVGYEAAREVTQFRRLVFDFE